MSDDTQSQDTDTPIDEGHVLTDVPDQVVESVEDVQPTEVKPAEVPPVTSSAGVVVLQWLTYAFWGWTILATIWLVYIVVANFILEADLTATIPYALAATLVLLPLSLVCDFFYGRKEIVKKTGVATVVMVIHAVLFALFGIGILISAVFTLVQMAIGSSPDIKPQLTMLTTLLISAGLYGFTFLRTLNPSPKLRIGLVYRIGMAVIIGVFIVLAFVGPVARSWATKDDRAIVANISSVSQAIDDYTQSNNKLPTSLDSLSLSPEAKALVSKGLVTFKPEAPHTVVDQTENTDRNTDGESKLEIQSFVVSVDYRYQLCATYTAANHSMDQSGVELDATGDGYNSYLSVYDHPAGQVCYKLKSTVSN